MKSTRVCDPTAELPLASQFLAQEVTDRHGWGEDGDVSEADLHELPRERHRCERKQREVVKNPVHDRPDHRQEDPFS